MFKLSYSILHCTIIGPYSMTLTSYFKPPPVWAKILSILWNYSTPPGNKFHTEIISSCNNQFRYSDTSVKHLYVLLQINKKILRGNLVRLNNESKGWTKGQLDFVLAQPNISMCVFNILRYSPVEFRFL